VEDLDADGRMSMLKKQDVREGNVLIYCRAGVSRGVL
jgi:hypothetical protein